MASSKTKTTKTKKKDEKIEETEEHTDETEETEDESFPIKSKKDPVIALDEHVEVEIPEEKPEDDIPLKIEEEDELVEEIGLDDEELDPFGDKWEE
jgi:hypothetical protein